MAPDPTRIDLFVIGAMKAATTTVCDWLAVQEGVAMSVPKEPSIFVSDATATELVPHIPELYLSAAPGALRAEGSTDYTKFPSISGVPERVFRHHPEARIVYLMREPLSRTISQYRFDWLRGAKRRTFDQAMVDDPQLVDNSRYAFQLERWLEWFRPDQVLLVFTEAFDSDANAQMRRILSHAGAPVPDVVVTPPQTRSNETAVLRRRTFARRVLRQSWVGRQVRPFVPDVVTAAYRRRAAGRSVPSISEQSAAALTARLDADLVDLTAMTGGPPITCATWDEVVARWTPALASH